MILADRVEPNTPIAEQKTTELARSYDVATNLGYDHRQSPSPIQSGSSSPTGFRFISWPKGSS